MALSRTDHGAFSRAGTSSPFVTSAFTPDSNSLLVVCVTCEDCPATFSADVAISGGGWTWTKRASADNDATGAAEGCAIFTAPVGTAASMTLSITGQGTNLSGLYARAFSYTGYNTSSPIGGTASFGDGTVGANTTTLTLTLDATPASDSVVLGLIDMSADAPGLAPGPSGGFTELFEEQLPATWQNNQIQHRTSSTSTTVDWTHASVTPDLRVGAAIEIKAAAAGGGAAARVVGTGLTESRFFRKTRLAKAPHDLTDWSAQGDPVADWRLAA